MADPDDLRARLRILANDYPVGSIHRNTVEQAIAALSALPAAVGAEWSRNDDMNPNFKVIREIASQMPQSAERDALLHAELAIGGQMFKLVDAAEKASATLGHAYHTVLTGALAEQAHKDYQRLDAVLDGILITPQPSAVSFDPASIDVPLAYVFPEEDCRFEVCYTPSASPEAFPIYTHAAPAAGKGVDDAALGRAYRRWYGAAKGYKDVDADAAHDFITREAALTRQPVAGMDTPKEGVKLYHWRLIERGSKMPLTGWNEVTKERFDEMRRLYFFGEGINGDFEGRVVEITSIETF